MAYGIITPDDLMDAILSLDVYDRTQNQGVFGLDDGQGTQIGDVKILKVSPSIENVDADGNPTESFYAIAYQYVSGPDVGKVVISYRGTDNFVADPITGWSVGAGIVDSNQAPLAVQFYQSVVQTLTGDSSYSIFQPLPSNAPAIQMTGHSLGGGLAGYVASLSHQTAVMFDHMPFGLAALATYAQSLVAAVEQSPDALSALGVDPTTPSSNLQDAIQTALNGASSAEYHNIAQTVGMIDPPTWAMNTVGFYINGEVNEGLRDGQIAEFLGGLLSYLPIIGSLIQAYGENLGTSQAALDADVPKSDIDLFPWTPPGIAPIDLHSQSLQIMLMYGSMTGKNGWLDNASAEKAILDNLYNDNLGTDLGLSKGATGNVAPSDQMQRMIAYSAIPEGTLVFGNTAIKALLDDANDLSQALSISTSLSANADTLGQIVDEFAGQLAYNQVTEADHPDAINGVLSVDANSQILTVDFSSVLWNPTGTQYVLSNIPGHDTLIQSVAGGVDMTSESQEGMTWLWGTSDESIFTRVGLNLNTSALDVTLSSPPESELNSSSPAVTLTQGTNLGDTIRGSAGDDYIVGGNGNDVLVGSQGHDFLYGGDGDDTYFSVGQQTASGVGQQSVFDGGAGNDTANFSFSSAVMLTVGKDMVTAIRSDGDGEDHIYNTENFVLSDASDTAAINAWSSVKIDGGGQDTAAGDTIDFSQVGTAVVFENGGEARAKVLDTNGTDPITSNLNEVHYSNFEYVIGTSGNDVYEDGTTQNAHVNLGGGEDVVKAAGAGSIIDLGADTAHDTVEISGGGDVEILDFGQNDELDYDGQQLRGGLENLAADQNYAQSMGGQVKFSISDGNLAVTYAGMPAAGVASQYANTFTIAGWASTYNSTLGQYMGNGGILLATEAFAAYLLVQVPDGVSVIAGQLALFDVTKYLATGIRSGAADPLVLDLNGDGFNLSLMSTAGTMFDVDADLYKEYTGWVGGQDGILVRDLNNNGQIDDSREMFGGTGSGFSVLASLDGNHDGVVNAADNGLADFNGDGVIDANDTFSELQIWQDANQDGIVEAGELKSLSDYDIVGLNTNATATSDDINGNMVTATSTFIRGDGTTGALGDVSLQLDNLDTTYAGADITISADAAAEPELKGFGTLVSLRQALSLDPDGIALANQTMASLDFNIRDLASLRTDVRPLLQAWADGSPIRDASGDIISGAQAAGTLENVSVVKDNGKVSDYSWSSGTGDLILNGHSTSVSTYTYVSGLELNLTSAENPDSLLGDWGTPVSISGVTITENGEDKTATQYTYANGESVIAVAPLGTTSEAATLQALVFGDFTTQDQQDHYTRDSIQASDLAFFERYYGEASPLNVKPIDTASALQMAQQYLDLMDQTLNVLAVRVAVQSPVFAPVFGSLVYDSTTNLFHSTSDAQLEPVYASLLTLADGQSDPGTWLDSWQDLLGVVVSDFDRGGGLLNTNGFLAQNLIAGYEAVNPSFSLQTAIEGFGLIWSQFVTGTGDLQGSANPDIFYIHGDGQTAHGGDGLDNYIVGAHFNNAVIDDYEAAGDPQSDDVIRFTTLNPDDLTFTRNGEDLIATVNATGESLTIVGQFHGESPNLLGGNDWADEGVATMVFADGTTWGDIDLAQAVSHPDPASTTLIGTADNDYLDGGAGDDVLEGGGDGDIYIFGRGYDHDTIIDTEDNPNRPAIDILEFKSGISEDDLVFHRDGNSNDLTITIAGDDADSITIDGQFAATYTGVFGTLFSNQIEMLSFADGGSMTADDIDQKVIDQSETAGNDTIYGFDRDDTLIGGKGDDFLSGGNGNDTYVFNLGDGHDTIADQETNILGGESDTLQFGPGISVSDVVFTRDGDDLIATIASTGDSVRIQGQYDFTETGPFGVRNFNLIENFTFADGTTMGWRSIMDGIIQASETPGNDHVVGTHFNDVIQGGTGDDLLEGGDGDDTYIFNIGDGHDTVNDVTNNILAGGDDDTIAFGAGISPSDIKVERTGDSLGNAVLTYDAAGDSITIDGQFTYGSINFRSNEIEHFTFADGTVWTPADLQQAYLTQHETSGDDVITGFYTDDVLDGGPGNDILRGGDGSDTYKFEMGFGNDRIEEQVINAAYADNDQIVFGAGLNSTDATLTRDGNDLIIGFKGMTDTVTVVGDFTHIAYFDGWQDVENVTFGDGVTWSLSEIEQKLISQSETSGDDVINGFWSADTFDGGPGNDVITGNGGGDTYLFGHGDGQDIVHADIFSVYDDKPDTLQFKADVAPSDVIFTRSGDDLVVSLVGTSDSVTISGSYASDIDKVENFLFSDGTAYTIAQVEAMAVANAGTSGSDTIYGTNGPDAIDGKGGNDVVHAGGGGDTILFNQGYGHLEIDETETGGTANTLALGAGIVASDVQVTTDSAGDLTLVLGTSGDQVKLDGMLADATRGVQTIHFADGTVWGLSDVLALAGIGTTGADSMYGTSGSDTFDGKGGGDYEKGNGGADIFSYASDYGRLEIDQDNSGAAPAGVLNMVGISSTQVSESQDGRGNVILTDGITGDTVVIDNMLKSTGTDQYGVASVNFADGVSWSYTQLLSQAGIGTPGNDQLRGTSGPDVIDGRGGNDYANGNGGNDTFIFNAGYGQLEIAESDSNPSAHNVLQLGAGIDPSNMEVTSDRFGDLILTDGISGDQITIDGERSDPTAGVQSVTFADGTTWSRQDLINLELTGTTGNDSIIGTSGADLIDGKGGSDYVQGDGGGDTFIFHAGYGSLEISEDDTVPNNVLQLGAGIDPSNISVTSDRFGDLILSDGISGDQITIDGELSSSASGVASVTFADGTTWSRQDMINRELTGTIGDDSIRGTSGADVIDGKGGSDYEAGNGGGDTFIYHAGYGSLEIDESDGAANPDDVLELGAGIDPSDISILPGRFGSIVLTDGVTGDQITLDGEANGIGSGVDSIVFADGTVWTRQDLLSTTINGTTGNDSLYGSSGGDVFDGKGGSDYEQGNGGGDTFIFHAGYGSLEINESDGAANPNNVLQLGAGIDPSDIVVSSDRWGDFILTDGISGDSITLDGQLSNPTSGVQSVTFADGTTWSHLDLIDHELTGTTGSDSIRGTSGADVIDGKGGSDYAQGNGGNDTFIFNSGYHSLEINESDSNPNAQNVLEFGPGIDPTQVTVTADRFGDLFISDGVNGDTVTLDGALSSPANGVQVVTFANGATWSYQDLINHELTGTTGFDTIYGTAGADTIDGRGGSDYVNGRGGNDTFIYHVGDGNLEIDETAASSTDNNELHLGAGIDASSMVVTADRYGNILLSDGTSGDQVKLDNAMSGDQYGVQTVVFADGTSWSHQDLVDKELNGTAGADTIFGTPGNDTIEGHAGNDDITGGGGADTFVFKAGFGNDTVEDFTQADSDVIQFDSSLFEDYSDVMAHAAVVGSDVVITYDANDTLTLKNIALANLHASDFHFV